MRAYAKLNLALDITGTDGEGYHLLVVPGTYAIGLPAAHQHYPVPVLVKPRAYRSLVGGLPVELVELVGRRPLGADLLPRNGILGPVGERLQESAVQRPLLNFLQSVLDPLVLNFVGKIVLNLHADGLGLDTQVHILGDQSDESPGIVVPDPHGGRQYAVVGDVVGEHPGELLRKRMVGLDLDGA